MKLKPCPFCGGEAEFIQEDIAGLYAVNCKECKCRTPFQFDFGEGSEKKALKVWNRRESIEKILQRLKEFEGAWEPQLSEVIEIVKGGAE